MERNLDIVREIFIGVESSDPGKEGKSLEELNNDYGKDVIDYHVTILVEAGLILGVDMTTLGDRYNSYIIQRLTWEGHEFLDAAKDSKNWEKAKTALGKLAGVPIEVVKALLVSYVKEELGL